MSSRYSEASTEPTGTSPGESCDSMRAISVASDAQWRALCELLGDPEWARDSGLATRAGRREKHDAIDERLRAWSRGYERGELAARLHLARTVCRRAERRMVRLARAEPVNESAIVYMNRLSDLLFACARAANANAGSPDVPWEKG